jgi:hypothetical protein
MKQELYAPVYPSQRSGPIIQYFPELRLGRQQMANNSRQQMFCSMMQNVVPSVVGKSQFCKYFKAK